MKNFILVGVAAAALAVGATAFAQEHVIPGSIGGMMEIPPAAQTNPDGGRIQTLPSGRTIIVDPSGREIAPGGIIGYDLWGRPIMGSSVYPGDYAYSGNTPYARSRRDRDGDGVPNRMDRYPDDPRYR